MARTSIGTYVYQFQFDGRVCTIRTILPVAILWQIKKRKGKERSVTNYHYIHRSASVRSMLRKSNYTSNYSRNAANTLTTFWFVRYATYGLNNNVLMRYIFRIIWRIVRWMNDQCVINLYVVFSFRFYNIMTPRAKRSSATIILFYKDTFARILH